MDNSENRERTGLSHEEKRKMLFLRQKETLDLFLERGAISRAQYEKSLGDLTAKMGMAPETDGAQRERTEERA